MHFPLLSLHLRLKSKLTLASSKLRHRQLRDEAMQARSIEKKFRQHASEVAISKADDDKVKDTLQITRAVRQITTAELEEGNIDPPRVRILRSDKPLPGRQARPLGSDPPFIEIRRIASDYSTSSQCSN